MRSCHNFTHDTKAELYEQMCGFIKRKAKKKMTKNAALPVVTLISLCYSMVIWYPITPGITLYNVTIHDIVQQCIIRNDKIQQNRTCSDMISHDMISLKKTWERKCDIAEIWIWIRSKIYGNTNSVIMVQRNLILSATWEGFISAILQWIFALVDGIEYCTGRYGKGCHTHWIILTRVYFDCPFLW